MSTPPPVREKRHRLPREFYRGEVTAAFTLCTAEKQRIFEDTELIASFVPLLRDTCQSNGSLILIYCFMPDHLHLILQGASPAADLWRAIVAFKQQSGWWLHLHRPDFRWQKDFYDHLVRKDEDLEAQMQYIANNPVRRGLVERWEDYPFTSYRGELQQ